MKMLPQEQVDNIRRRVRDAIASIEAGDYAEHEGREGLKRLAEKVKASGRKILAAKISTR